MNSVAQTLELAVQHHQAGRLESAARLYREIVRLDPRHADALHLLGIASHQRNKSRTAVEYISRAIAVNGSTAIYHSNLGAAYQALGEIDAAIECFHEALRISPDYVDAWHNLAAVLHAEHRLEEAAIAYSELVRVSGNEPRYRIALGGVLKSLGRSTEAVEQFRLAMESDPDCAEAHFALGVALRGNGRLDEAATCFEQVLQIQPRHSRAHNNLGGVLHDRGNVVAAIRCYAKAIEIDPDYADAHCNLGTALKAMGRMDEAVASYRTAISLRPEFADAWFNLGNLHRDRDDLDSATECYRHTLALVPSHVKARVNLAVTLKDQRKIDEALACYETVLAAHPDLAEANFNRSLIWLLRGEFARGWDAYEWRWEHDPRPNRYRFPFWDGASAAGRKILITAEQGIGDEIMFAACLADVIRAGARCIVECDRRLVSLFARSFPAAKFFAKGDGRDCEAALAAVDWQVPCGSLPRFFRRCEEDFPKCGAWLKPHLALCDRWTIRLNELGDGLKVGISWFGGKDAETRRRRSTPLEFWRGVLEQRGVQFVNLQYGDVHDALAELKGEFGVTIHAWNDVDPLRDLDDFASLVASLDLVISVDNSTVHLAGAVGTPVWTLLPFASDWRWLLDGDESPWYPSMRLFRQRAQGAWPDVFARVVARLGEGAAGGRMPDCSTK
jgi:tetratricopeptide (TPR) repeat protein